MNKSREDMKQSLEKMWRKRSTGVLLTNISFPPPRISLGISLDPFRP